jgi:branched-chain amino acid transport system ATP-binding protein
MMSASLEVRDLHVGYGNNEVLHGVDISVPAGAKVALLGANGAGKSTLLRTISGLHRPTHGTITFAGDDIVGRGSDEVVRLGVVHVPEGRRVFANMTVEENLRVAAVGAQTRPATGIGKVYDAFPILHERRHQAAGLLSGGQQQMLALGRAIVAQPRCVLIDEVSLGLAPILVKQFLGGLDDYFDPGTSMLIVEQNAKVALDFVDHVYILRNGSISGDGGVNLYRESEELLHAGYFGVS